jgi:hypothetical protein
MKKCTKCNIEKDEESFYLRGKGLRRTVCRMCYNTNWKYRLLGTLISKEHRNTQTQHKEKHCRDREINGAFLEELKKKQNGMCYWLKIPIDFTMKDKLRKPSLDRLDNSIGYRVDNIVLTTVFANTGRNSATVEEMLKFISDYL